MLSEISDQSLFEGIYIGMFVPNLFIPILSLKSYSHVKSKANSHVLVNFSYLQHRT